MDIITLDFESYWATDHSLTHMSPIAYVMHPDTEIISCAIKVNNYPTDVFFGEYDVRSALKSIDKKVRESLLIAHNMSGFDALICAWRFGMRPKMWGCTLAMARPVHAITVGNSLAKLVNYYELGVKDNTALIATKGRHLKDFTAAEIAAMKVYNRDDTEQCYALFHKLKSHYTAKELWHIDATIRMLVEPAFDVDLPMLETALTMERDQKRKHILMLAKHLRSNALVQESDAVGRATTIHELEEAVRADLASAPKFSALLNSLGVETPMKQSPTNPEKRVPALAKTDEGFIALQEHDNPLVASATRARLAVKSTLLETRLQAFIDAAVKANGKLPVPLNYCGATTTGRWSGFLYNPQNLPRVTPGKPKVSDALRNCLKAPNGFSIVVDDLSGIELRVNHFLWRVKESMALYQSDAQADLYKAFAAVRYQVSVEQVDKMMRQMGKVAHLGLGFGAGWVTFQRFAKMQYGLVIDDEESQRVVEAWRAQYAEICAGWRTCGASLLSVECGEERAVDPLGLVTTCSEGLRLPSGRLIRYPNLRREDDGLWTDGRKKRTFMYADGRFKARLTGPKMTENIVQALARDVIADNALDVFKLTGRRPALMVHDELVYVVEDAQAAEHLEVMHTVMRKPPKWWPELVVYSEGDVGKTYGAAK